MNNHYIARNTTAYPPIVQKYIPVSLERNGKERRKEGEKNLTRSNTTTRMLKDKGGKREGGWWRRRRDERTYGYFARVRRRWRVSCGGVYWGL